MQRSEITPPAENSWHGDAIKARRFLMRKFGASRAEIRSCELRLKERFLEVRLRRAEKFQSVRLSMSRLHSTQDIELSETLGDFHGHSSTCAVKIGEETFVLKKQSHDLVDTIGDAFERFFCCAPGFFFDRDENFGWNLRPWLDYSANQTSPEDQANSLGRVAAFSALFNVSDLHFENVLLNEGRYVPIDIECAISALDTTQQSFSWDFLSPVGFSNLRNPLFGRSLFDYFDDPFIQGEKISIVRKKRRTEHLARGRNGRPISLRRYKPAVMQGFADGLDQLRSKNFPEAALARAQFHQPLTRKIFRPTRFYRVLISELMLNDPVNWRRIIINRLKLAGGASTIKDLFNCELTALLDLNIPIFHVNVHSGRVFSNYTETNVFASVAPIRLWQTKLIHPRHDKILTATLSRYWDKLS